MANFIEYRGFILKRESDGLVIYQNDQLVRRTESFSVNSAKARVDVIIKNSH